VSIRLLLRGKKHVLKSSELRLGALDFRLHLLEGIKLACIIRLRPEKTTRRVLFLRWAAMRAFSSFLVEEGVQNSSVELFYYEVGQVF